jgi:hypothetical protein
MTITPQQHATALAAAQAELKLQSELEDTFGVGLWFEDPAGADGMRIDGLLNLPALVTAILSANDPKPVGVPAGRIVEVSARGNGKRRRSAAYLADDCALPIDVVQQLLYAGWAYSKYNDQPPRWTKRLAIELLTVARSPMSSEALGEETKANIERQVADARRRHS